MVPSSDENTVEHVDSSLIFASQLFSQLQRRQGLPLLWRGLGGVSCRRGGRDLQLRRSSKRKLRLGLGLLWVIREIGVVVVGRRSSVLRSSRMRSWVMHCIRVVRMVRRHVHVLAGCVARDVSMHLGVHLGMHLSMNLPRHGDALSVSILKRHVSHGWVLVGCTWGGIGVVLNRNLDMFEAGVCARLSQLALIHILPSIVTDQVELETSSSSDAERLLEKTTLLVLEAFFLFLWTSNWVLLVSFHFSVSQE